MATGKRLLEESMPANCKSGLYPTHYSSSIKKSLMVDLENLG